MKVFVVAGEPSGDRLGAALMQGFHQLGVDVTWQGVGGPLMQAEGLQSLFPMSDIAVMGIGEILSRYRHLKRRIRQTAEAALAMQPDVVITIDLPEFSLRVARMVKAAAPGLRTVHYVAPTVWAWRPGRARKMAAHIDQVLALLPFEPPYMQAVGMECDFVGHPVVTEPQASAAEVAAFRADHAGAPRVLVLPGSRGSEIDRLAPIFGEVVARFSRTHPDARFYLPVAGNVADRVHDAVADWPNKPVLIAPDDRPAKRAAFAGCDVALAASGTVSLELAAAGTPMVIAYDMAWLSRQIIGRMLRVDTVTLVNLVAESRTIPEFIGKDCDPARIADALGQVLEHPGGQVEAMALTMDRLGRGGDAPGLRAARAVMDRLPG